MGSARHWREQSEGQRSGAVVHARGRPHRTPRGWLSPTPKRRETLDPRCADNPASLASRPACDQAYVCPPHLQVSEQRDHGLGRSGFVAARMRCYRTQAPARQRAQWWRQGPAEYICTPACWYGTVADALPTQRSGPGKSTVPVAGAM